MSQSPENVPSVLTDEEIHLIAGNNMLVCDYVMAFARSIELAVAAKYAAPATVGQRLPSSPRLAALITVAPITLSKEAAIERLQAINVMIYDLLDIDHPSQSRSPTPPAGEGQCKVGLYDDCADDFACAGCPAPQAAQGEREAGQGNWATWGEYRVVDANGDEVVRVTKNGVELPADGATFPYKVVDAPRSIAFGINKKNEWSVADGIFDTLPQAVALKERIAELEAQNGQWSLMYGNNDGEVLRPKSVVFNKTENTVTVVIGPAEKTPGDPFHIRHCYGASNSIGVAELCPLSKSAHAEAKPNSDQVTEGIRSNLTKIFGDL